MQILLDTKTAPSRLEKFKVLNITKEKVSIRKIHTEEKHKNHKKEQQNQSASTEKDNLKRRFLGPQNTYPRTRETHLCQPPVAGMPRDAQRHILGLGKSQ